MELSAELELASFDVNAVGELVGIEAYVTLELIDYSEPAPAEGGPSLDLEDTAVDYAPESELDAGLIETINAIGASVLSETTSDDVGEPSVFDTPAVEAPNYESRSIEADIGSDEPLMYDPAFWEAGLTVASAETPEMSKSDQEPEADDEETETTGSGYFFGEPFVGEQPAQTSEPDEAVALILDKIGHELLPETDAYDSVDGSPATRILYREETPQSQAPDQSHEVFSALLRQRGLSTEDASIIITEGLVGDEVFTDTTEYVETATGLVLIRNKRVFEDSGRATSELAATHSLEAYLKKSHVRSQGDPNTPNLNVHWDEDDHNYELEWREGNNTREFPEDVEVSLREEFQDRWKAEAQPSTLIIINDQLGEEKPDDPKILAGVHKSLERARRQALAKPDVTRN